MSPCLTPQPAPAVRVVRQSLRMALTCFTAIGLSGCGGFFESVASFFGGEVDATALVTARDQGLAVPPPKPVREEFCYREAQYLRLQSQECHYYGGRMVSVRGGLEALRNRQIGRPDVAPVPEVEIVAVGAAGMVAAPSVIPAGPATRHPAVVRGQPVSGAASGAGAAGWPGIPVTGPAVTGIPAGRAVVGRAVAGRAVAAPSGAAIGRCYREYRYLDFDPEDCFELGGVVVDDSFVPGPQPLHKIRPGVPVGPVSDVGAIDAAGPVVSAARLDPRAADYLSGRPARAAGPIVHRPLNGSDLRAAAMPAAAAAPTMLQPAPAMPVSAYRLRQDVWRCRLDAQLLRLSIEDCAAAGGSMSRGDVMEDMHGIAMPTDPDVPVAGGRLGARLAPARAGLARAGLDRMPATGARRDIPAPISDTAASVPAVTAAAMPAIPLPRPAVDTPATVAAPTMAAAARAVDGMAETVATALPASGAASLWPAPQHRLVNRTADKWDAMPPAPDAGSPAGKDATGKGSDPRPARQFCFRNGQHLILSPADCAAAGGITVIGRRGPVAAPIMPAIPPAASAESAPLVTPLRLNQLIAAR